MTRQPDPYLPGAVRGPNGPEVGLPPLMLPAEWVAELLPAVRQWKADHERQGAQAKLAAAAPILQRWEYLAALQRRAFAAESGGCAVVGDGGPSQHDRDEITAAQAAEQLGCSPQWVTELCRRGELAGRKLGRAWLVDPASLTAHKQRAA